MEFETQAQLLRYLGKNENDRSLVQRMIIRGEVLKENGMYILVDKDKKIEELISEVEKLRHEITTMKESDWDLDEAKAQWDYYEKLYNDECELVEKVVKKFYNWMCSKNMKVDWDEFRDWLFGNEE